METISETKSTFIPRPAECLVRDGAPNKDRGYDNVLLGQDFRTPRGAVRWVWINGGMMISRESWRTRRETCSSATTSTMNPSRSHWTGVYAARRLRIAAWAMARPQKINNESRKLKTILLCLKSYVRSTERDAIPSRHGNPMWPLNFLYDTGPTLLLHCTPALSFGPSLRLS
jgi:hypothetical protein